MNEHYNIIKFIQAVQERLNRGLLLRCLQWSALLAGICLVIIGTVFICCGHRIPLWIYFATVLAAVMTFTSMWYILRADHHKASLFADNFFQLRDGIISYIGFQSKGQSDGVYKLQAHQVDDSVSKAPSAQTIPLGLSRRVCMLASVLLVTGLLLGFVDDSDRIKAQKQLEIETLDKTAQVNTALIEELEDVLKELNEKQLDDPEIAREKQLIEDMVKELDQTEDPKEALSQYAQLEKQLNKMLNSNLQRKDELLLDKVGQELKDGLDGKKLGQKLTAKDYKAAADELRQHKQKLSKDEKESLKKFAQLKTIAQQMAATAAASQSKSSASKQNQNSSGKQGQNNAMANASSGGSQSDKSSDGMSSQMAQLNQAVQQCEKDGCQNCNNVNQKLDQLANSLCKLGSKRNFQQKMQKLAKTLSQCQGFMCNSQCNCLGQCLKPGSKPGGKNAGIGSVDSRTDAVTPDYDNGNYTSLQGLKGSGPSQVITEETDSGTGVSTAAETSRQVVFRQQAEAYVMRQDVPSEVKQGVKRYFENIHLED